MKKAVLLFYIILLQGCISRKSTEYDLRGQTILKAKFFKIQTINNLHIYHFKNDSIEGVFPKVVDSSFINKNFKKIKLNKNYTLILQKEIYANTRTEIDIESFTDNGILIWKTGMKSSYFVDCENIVGDQINPRFTLLKYIDPNSLKH
jgi:PBP1b-binding outer membrane lipoprotein LpoB